MNFEPIRGYCDRPNVRAGESVDIFVSAPTGVNYRSSLVRLINGDPNPLGPGYKEEVIGGVADGEHRGFRQRTQVGGYVEIPDPDAALACTGSMTLQLFLWPTTPGKRQGVVSRWSEADQSGWALMVEDGRIVFVCSDGTKATRVVGPAPLFPETWYSVWVRVDAVSGTVTLAQEVTLNSVNSRFGRIVDIASDGVVSSLLMAAPAAPNVPFIIGGLAEAAGADRTRVTALYNGKVDAPKLYARALDDSDLAKLSAGGAVSDALAHWDFAAGIGPNGIPTDLVRDVSGSGLDGNCVNQPDRGMTGWNWEGREEHFVHCPEQYGALWFHEDSLEDCRWQRSFTVNIPVDLPSGAYAVKLEHDGAVDRIPFFVVPPAGKPRAKIALVIPTFSYMAYANTQVLQNATTGQAVMGVLTTLDARDLALHLDPAFGRSTYDYHIDGRGVQYSSWRRPILNMRPDYRHEFGSVWQFPADLHLIDWLNAKGFEVDIVTDHDLHVGGVDVLQPYNAVITPTHPEYYSWEMLDGLEGYVAAGGRAMYLGANGFYWIASVHPEKPWMIEVRKGESGDQAWRARPGELYHSTTGERGGIWRHRARAPQKLWGVGYTSHGLDVSVGYHQMPDSADPRLGWIMEGIGRDEIIGDFGLVNDGACGLEMDRIDYSLGSPPNTMLIASSHGHSASAMLVPEDQYFAYPGITGKDNPLVRGDIAFVTTKNGGAVFSASSMAWCGSLSHGQYDNNVSRMTENVLRRFAQDGPIEEVT